MEGYSNLIQKKNHEELKNFRKEIWGHPTGEYNNNRTLMAKVLLKVSENIKIDNMINYRLQKMSVFSAFLYSVPIININQFSFILTNLPFSYSFTQGIADGG